MDSGQVIVVLDNEVEAAEKEQAMHMMSAPEERTYTEEQVKAVAHDAWDEAIRHMIISSADYHTFEQFWEQNKPQ